MGRLVILTGARQVGKSTVCAELVTLAGEAGFKCGGIITLAHDGEREVVDVRTRDRRRLTHSPGEGPAVMQGRFRFSPQTLRWAVDVLAKATPCDLFVVDELGPLEVVRGAGWASALDVLREGAFALAVAVVRPELVETVSALLPGMEPQVLAVTRETRSRLPGVLLQMLGASS